MNTKLSNLKLLHDRRDKLRADVEAAKARLDEVESLIRMMTGEAAPTPSGAERRPRRGDLKDVVLTMYDEAGEVGLSSAECIKAAREKRGTELQPASVSSLLSRLKSDGVLFYDGERYRLKRFAGPRSAA